MVVLKEISNLGLKIRIYLRLALGVYGIGNGFDPIFKLHSQMQMKGNRIG